MSPLPLSGVSKFRANVLIGHNYYQQPGGEDRAFSNEAALLERRGHRVVRYTERNSRIGTGIRAASGTIWSQPSFRRIQALERAHSFDVAHFHNTFPLISPAAYFATRTAGVPVVQTLHNYRLICPGATLLRNGAVCEQCIERRSLLPALANGCYRNSRPATAMVSAMLSVHRAIGTWQNAVDVYIALSEFAREKFIAGGLPASRIAVKPNFLATDPGPGDGRGGYALFVGRLAEEKGIHILAEAWHRLDRVPLLVAGDGTLRGIDWPKGVAILGPQTHRQVLTLMRGARLLIFPSIWYECAPLTIIEALACGLPVIASNLGSIPEFVADRRTGLLFRPSDSEDLAAQVQWAFNHLEQIQTMRAAARREFEEKYTADRNYKMLMNIYELAIANSRRAVSRRLLKENP